MADSIDRDDLLAWLVHTDRVVALDLYLIAGRQERVETNDEARVALEEGGHPSNHPRRVNPAATHRSQ